MFSYFDSEEPVFPGDVGIELIICTDVAAREGTARADSSYADELMLYLVHGLLHSSGEDDLTDEAAKSMRRREAEVLAGLTPIFDFSRNTLELHNAGHLDYERVFLSPDIDMISSPSSYGYRSQTDPSGFMVTQTTL